MSDVQSDQAQPAFRVAVNVTPRAGHPRPAGPGRRAEPAPPGRPRRLRGPGRPPGGADGAGRRRADRSRDRRPAGAGAAEQPADRGLQHGAARIHAGSGRGTRGGDAMKIGVVVFPGSNCDTDTMHGLRLAGAEPVELWHESADLQGVSAVVLPGGFAYGDYIRAGVIARFSPVMRSVAAFAADGGLVLGICNGFQVLAEAGPPARRAAPQPLAAVRRSRGRDRRPAGRHAVHAGRRRRPAAAHARRPRRGLLLRRRRDPRRAGGAGPGPLPVRRRRRPAGPRP